MKHHNKTFICPTCGQRRSESLRVSSQRLRASLLDRLRLDHPEWDGRFTCREDVRKSRIALLRDKLAEQRGTVGSLDQSVLERMQQNQLISRNLQDAAPAKGDLGGRVADAVASFGGSWPFLGLFASVMLAWILTNIVLLSRPFDPYPFILLNLVLSCLASIQAPVIMMSQNRHSLRDRQRAEHDYEINLKAELEVQLLHEKLDHLLLVEWQRLLDTQALHTEMLEELAGAGRTNETPKATPT